MTRKEYKAFISQQVCVGKTLGVFSSKQHSGEHNIEQFRWCFSAMSSSSPFWYQHWGEEAIASVLIGVPF